MAFTRAELSGPLLFGDDKSLYYYDAEDASDTFASVAASGYFNNTDDNLRLAVGDVINVKSTTGYGVLEVSAISSGTVTCEVVNADSVVESVSTSQGITGFGTSVIGAAGIYALNGALVTGQRKSIACIAGLGAVTITSTGAPIGTTGGSLIFRAGGTGADLVAASTSRWVVVSTAETSSTGLTDITTS